MIEILQIFGYGIGFAFICGILSLLLSKFKLSDEQWEGVGVIILALIILFSIGFYIKSFIELHIQYIPI